jgi:hypothetical protein
MKAARLADRHWERMLKILRIFCRTHGHADVPPNPAPDSLSHWLAKQRRAWRDGRLDQRQVKRLENLGVLLPAGTTREERYHEELNRRFDEMFQKLVAFKQQHGHCDVRLDDGHGGKLRTWVLNRRNESRAGNLRADRRQQLEQIGFLWHSHNPRWDNWDRHYTKLVAYKERFGDCDVPWHWPEDSNFAHWVSNQRSFRRKGILSPERTERLEQLGFSWDTRFRLQQPPRNFAKMTAQLNQLWDRRFAELVAFHQEHGHFWVPRDRRWISLSDWVTKQRQRGRNGLLAAEQRARLESIGCPWQGSHPTRDKLWEQRFTELAAYRQRFGHCDVPSGWAENLILARWVICQRYFRRKGILSPARIARLDRLGFSWNIKNITLQLEHPSGAYVEQVKALNDNWDRHFAELAAYVKQHGHCRVPAQEPRWAFLYQWIRRQRKQARAGVMPAQRRAQLERLGFPWEIINSTWERNFEMLRAFRQRFGHCATALNWPENPSLSSWVQYQRTRQSRGTLKPEQEARLNALGFKWSQPPEGKRPQ